MRLITELTDTVEYVTEAREGKSPDHFITGRFMVAEEKNKNGRIYPLHVLKPEVERYVTEMVKTGRSLGECGHPSGPTVNLERASHLITELKQNGNGFDGRAKLVNTPMGNIVKGLLESGAKIGVSTRGMGSLKENNGAMEVQKDFKLSSIDCVSDPSGPGCFVNGILEGVEYFYDDARGTWKEEKIVEMKETMHKMSKSQREEQAFSLMEEYFSLLIEKSILPQYGPTGRGGVSGMDVKPTNQIPIPNPSTGGPIPFEKGKSIGPSPGPSLPPSRPVRDPNKYDPGFEGDKADAVESGRKRR